MDIHEFPPNLEASYYYKYFKYSPFVTSQCWVWKDSHLRCVLLPWIQYLESFGEAWLSCNHSSFDSWGDCRTPNLGSPYSCLHVYMAWSRGLVSSVCGRADVLVVHHGWKILWCTTSLSGHAAIVIKFLVLPPWRQGHASCSDVSPTSCTYQRVPLSQTVTSLEIKSPSMLFTGTTTSLGLGKKEQGGLLWVGPLDLRTRARMPIIEAV
jgi:hypothetical protein